MSAVKSEVEGARGGPREGSPRQSRIFRFVSGGCIAARIFIRQPHRSPGGRPTGKLSIPGKSPRTRAKAKRPKLLMFVITVTYTNQPRISRITRMGCPIRVVREIRGWIYHWSGNTGIVAKRLPEKVNAVPTIGLSLVMRIVPKNIEGMLGKSCETKNAVWLFAASVRVTGESTALPLLSRS